jgi:hypothetical protein
MRSLHDVHQMSAYGADHIFLSVRLLFRVIELENLWTDLDEIWYGHNVIGGYQKLVLLYEDGYLLGCSAVLSGRSLPTFQRSLLPPGRWP